MNFVLVVVIQKLIKKQMTNCLRATVKHCVAISFFKVKQIILGTEIY